MQYVLEKCCASSYRCYLCSLSVSGIYSGSMDDVTAGFTITKPKAPSKLIVQTRSEKCLTKCLLLVSYVIFFILEGHLCSPHPSLSSSTSLQVSNFFTFSLATINVNVLAALSSIVFFLDRHCTQTDWR